MSTIIYHNPAQGVRLCRPSKLVIDLLDAPWPKDVTKQDGQRLATRTA